jgi:cobaltochelatase CobS
MTMTKPNTKRVNINQALGVDFFRADMEFNGFDDPENPYIPTPTPYVFSHDLTKKIIGALMAPMNDALYLTGPRGAGKTSGVEQIAARLDWPVQAVTCHNRTELDQLVGQFVLVNGVTRFQHGPLARAMAQGHILLMNEVDLMDPGELAGLNDVIERKPLVVVQNGGQAIRPHPMFRVVLTGNTAGEGDDTGDYLGTGRLNKAFLDRCRWCKVDYMDREQELQAVLAHLPTANQIVVAKMIEVANETRRLFVGGDEGSCELTVTFSTRTVIRWVHLATIGKRTESQPLLWGLTQALTDGAKPDQREAIHKIAEGIFGDMWHPQGTQP